MHIVRRKRISFCETILSFSKYVYLLYERSIFMNKVKRTFNKS